MTEKKLVYIIEQVRNWNKGHIDYIELKARIEDCIKSSETK